MSDMKCPVCKGELYIFKSSTQDAIVCADCGFDGNTKLWQELIRTRKALDKAKWWLHEIVESHRCTPISTAEMALKEITAAEQKDNK